MTHLESFAVFYVRTLFFRYLKEVKCSVLTDYRVEEQVLNLVKTSGKLVNWALKLMEHISDITHSADIKHQLAQAFLKGPM